MQRLLLVCTALIVILPILVLVSAGARPAWGQPATTVPTAQTLATSDIHSVSRITLPFLALQLAVMLLFRRAVVMYRSRQLRQAEEGKGAEIAVQPAEAQSL